MANTFVTHFLHQNFVHSTPHSKYSPKCAACGKSISPIDGTGETVRVVSMVSILLLRELDLSSLIFKRYNIYPETIKLLPQDNP